MLDQSCWPSVGEGVAQWWHGRLNDLGRGAAGSHSTLGGSVPGTVARVTEISARSDTSFEDAVKLGLDRANATLRNVTSAWVKEQSVDVANGAISAYRVNLLVTFVLE
jgi:flavin-binding protein dodecin